MITNVTLTTTTCPRCGAKIVSDPQYVTWCEHCEWNLDPQPAKPKESRPKQRRAERSDKAARTSFERVMAHGPHTDPVRHGVVFALATPVHALIAALAAGLVLLFAEPVTTWVRIVGGILLAGLLWQLRPRLGRVSRHAHALTPHDAPHTFALLDKIAAATGARCPQLLLVQPHDNAAYGIVGLRRRRVLVIGLPLWNCLSPRQKLALLGHEMGHDVNRDVRRHLYLRTAVQALHEWGLLLAPIPALRQRRANYRQSPRGRTLLLLEHLTEVVLAPIALLVRFTGHALHKATDRDGQTAEYRADVVAARVAGRGGAESLLRHLLLGDRCMNALRFAATRHTTDVWAAQRQAVEAMPQRERDRCERLARHALLRADDSHPPSHFRLDFIRSLDESAPLVNMSDDTMAAVDGEIYRYANAIAGYFAK